MTKKKCSAGARRMNENRQQNEAKKSKGQRNKNNGFGAVECCRTHSCIGRTFIACLVPYFGSKRHGDF